MKLIIMSRNAHNPIEDIDRQHCFEYLSHIDPVFTVILDTYGLPPPRKKKERFDSLVKIILEQQVSLASAQAAFDKLGIVLTSITPENFLTLDNNQLKAIGFSRQKTRYVRNLAYAVLNGELNLEALQTLPDGQARSVLTSIKGIGVWTANIYLLTAMQRPDIWPKGDIALAASYQQLKQLPSRPTNDEMERKSCDWAPCRSDAARLLWHYYLSADRKSSR